MTRIPTIGHRIPTADTRRVKPPPKQAESFYTSAAWIEMRDRVRREARGRCQRPGCTNPGRIVDHIVELRDGGAPLARSNLELLCQSHHTAKTADARARRAGIR
jgi:5-methylcytosine-specific restriction enzyme A